MAYLLVKRKISAGSGGPNHNQTPYYSDPPNTLAGFLDKDQIVYIYKPTLLTDAEKRNEQHDGYSKTYNATRVVYGFVEDTHILRIVGEVDPDEGEDPNPPPVDSKKYHIEFPGGIDITVV